MVDIIRLKVPASSRQILVKNIRGGIASQLQRRAVPRMRAVMVEWLYSVAQQALRESKVKVRTGRMRKEIRNRKNYRVTGAGRVDTINAVIRGSVVVYVQEYGAKIRPKTARALTIPLPPALRSNGIPIFRKASTWRRYKSFVYKSQKTGNAYIARKDRKGNLVLLYLLVNKADVPARLGLRRMIQRRFGELTRAWMLIFYDEMAQVDMFRLVSDGYERDRKIGNRLSRIPFGRAFRPVRRR